MVVTMDISIDKDHIYRRHYKNDDRNAPIFTVSIFRIWSLLKEAVHEPDSWTLQPRGLHVIVKIRKTWTYNVGYYFAGEVKVFT